MTQHKDVNMHIAMHVYYLERDFLLQKLKEEKAANTIFKGKVAHLTAQNLPSFVRYFMIFLSFFTSLYSYCFMMTLRYSG